LVLKLKKRGKIEVSVKAQSDLVFPPFPPTNILHGFGDRKWFAKSGGGGGGGDARVRITVYQAIGLEIVHNTTKYHIIVDLRVRKGKPGKMTANGKTKCKYKTAGVDSLINPYWKETFICEFAQHDYMQIVVSNVEKHLKINKKDKLGVLVFSRAYDEMKELALPLEKQQWFPLKKGKGFIGLGFQALNGF